MKLAFACVLAALAIPLVSPGPARGQSVPSVLRRGTPQRTAEQAPPLPTIMRPAESEVVVGDLVIAVQVPPQVPARRYTMEAAYWDSSRNDWVYTGTFGEDFSGGTTATTRVAAGLRMKWSEKATRWKVHARTTEPPGGWGPWREFGWQAAPAVDRAAPATTTPTPVGAPANTANPATGEAGKPGIMVPGTTTPQPGQPATGTPPSAPSSGPPDTRTAPPTPPSTNLPAVQQPPTRTIPEPSPPDTRAVPPTPPSTNLPAVQQPPTRTIPEPGPPDTRAVPPTPPSTNLPAVQQPPRPAPPPVLQPPVQVPPAVVPAPPPPPAPAPPQPARTAPSIPNITSRLPVRLPANAAPGATTAPPSQPVKSPSGNPVSVAGHTKLDVWDGKPMPASNQRVYVSGPVDVDWAKTTLPWWFRAITTAPTAVPGKFRWEMSRAPFPDFAVWQAIPGYGYTGLADGVQFFIVLDSYAPRPSDWPVAVSVSAQPAPTAAAPGAGTKAGGGPSAPTFSQRFGIPADLLGSPPGKQGQVGKLPKLPSTLPASLSLYVRVVPLDKAGNAADLPSNTVELRFGPSEKAPPFDLNPKYWPVVSFVSYRPVQGYTFDWQCWVKASKDITAPDFVSAGVNTGTTNNAIVLYHEGETWNSCEKKDSSFVDDFVDAVGGFVDMLGSFVNWVSKTYSSLKSAVASQLVSVIPGCESSPVCQAAVQAGLNAGMAALGMPPDLPDFEQLQAMGEGYLVEAIAQQVAAQTNLSAVDEVAAKALMEEFIKKGKEAMQGGKGSSPWIPDDSKQYKPLFLTLAITNPSGSNTTPAMYLEVREPGGSRYSPITVAIPALPPGQSVKVSAALKPLKDPKAWMDLLPTAEEYLKAYSLMGSSGEQKVVQTKTEQANAALKDWRAAYLTGVVNLQATLKLPPFVAKVAYETSCFANKQGCLVQ